MINEAAESTRPTIKHQKSISPNRRRLLNKIGTTAISPNASNLSKKVGASENSHIPIRHASTSVVTSSKSGAISQLGSIEE